MLEHSAMYLNVPPQYEDDTSFFPDFYTRLGPCELQDPAWAKMSALATGVNKKRKKSETKPQAQINKCNNEKRRREQENIYIEELAELISANFADMSSLSVKPDKCAILQETVNQIRSIKQRESASQSSDPVQQGEVSSSRPTILSNEVYGPLLLEALEGFLFVVNAEGKVEHVTENVSNYIKFTRDEIFGNSIYNFIHLGDHARFTTSLMPMIGWGSESTTTTRSRSFSVRFLVKPPDDQDETVEEKQQRVNCYELMHISSTQLRDQVSVSDDDGADSGPYLLCVASRISHRDKVISGIEQFTTKLDTSGKIIGVDASGVSAPYSQFINKELMDRALRDLVFQQDVHKLNTHLKETIHTGQATSAVYRLQLGQDKYVQVQTKSKLFKTNPHNSNDIDFIMATHSIVGEYDATGPSDPGGGGTSSVGGPLMTSVVNGTRNGTAPVSSGSDSSTASSNALMNAGNASFTPYIDNDFPFDIFPTSTFELEPSGWTEARPDSRQSATPVSTPTPRPPSNPAYSPATTVAQSPLAPFVTQPSPSTPAAPNPYTSTFSFSPLSEQNYNVEEPKDTKANVLDEASSMMADSARLRNLLTKPPTVADSSANDADGRNKNRILKGLLNQQDEDDNRNDNRASPRGGLISRGAVAGPSELPKTSTAGGNNMLLQLLNERSDDDDNLEARAGVRKKSELLHQLLKTESRENEDEKKNDVQSHDDSLLRSLGFTSSPSPPSGEPGRSRKRPSDDRDENVSSKRTSDGSQVSSTGAGTGSKLCEKNKMLASLLAKTPNNQQPIPHIPVSLMSATPQDILPRISSLPETVKTSKPMPTRSTTSVTQQRTVVKNTLPDNMSRMGARQPTTNYLTTMLTHPNSMHHQRTPDNRQMAQVDSGSYTSPATSSTDGNIDASMWVDNNNSNDPLLSDILDQVMDIVPDEVGRTFSAGEGQQPNNFHPNELSEKMAINIIQKSLMQCESVVKSPSSPTITLPGTPPAYTPAAMTTQNSQMRPFQPPPNYNQASFIAKQRLAVRPGAPQYAVATGGLTNSQQLQIQRRQQEEKRRLLQQQQQQELLIPSNATAAEINSGLQNIDSLLNNTVAPNVSLQRSASLPESQLSPNYGGQLNQPNQRINSQQPYSPHSQLVSPIGQQAGFPQTSAANYQQAGARLSPQFTQQMALRQAYPQGSAQGQNWQQNQARLSLQNPMLNAQLTRAPNQPSAAQQQQQQQQQQRSLNSPGTVTSRHSPYQQDSFPPPSSPNSTAFNQTQYLRLQRANSVPTATTQLPGGLGSPRPYGREHHPHPYPPIPPNPHQHPMMYQQDSSQYCYDQTGLQLAYNGADRGRAPPHLQAGVSASGPTSEFVRQELRAVVGARTGQAQTAPNRTQSQLLNQQQVDLEALGITFEMPTSGASDSPKLWGAMGSDMGSMSPQPATSRSSMEEARAGDHGNKSSSLLQKLLSE
ncbi:nuclear receptor coactivator 2 isoform X3 [Tribolium castaneum]|uniref:nuclear receptor coactivator 2 isoform X3 n=1 Tax=Tribolium castaneum TaxID=7070 RepID=UPI00046C2E65|nr:PREDICTED: nuclear receptor coactivator 2 isoform X3 [Tribolium castaneum]|eukprot:XP_008193624.1 PREDICTED: nuclear receptor coactivator 2 isoform X3 [Tribolium castaneum]